MKTLRCRSNGASRNDAGFLDLYCEFCKGIVTEEEDGEKICPFLLSKESETTNYLYSEVKRLENKLNIVKQAIFNQKIVDDEFSEEDIDDFEARVRSRLNREYDKFIEIII